MSKKHKKTSDALTILHNRYIKGDAGRLAAIEAERAKIKIAEQVYALRTERGLTQQQLADAMETTQSVISRLENTDYESERIETLQKLATALQCHLEVRFVPQEKLALVQQSEEQEVSQGSESACICFEDYMPAGDHEWDWGQKRQYG